MRNISFFTLVEIALRHILIIIVSGMLTGIGPFCFCEFVAVPQYSATGSIMVTNGSIVSDKTTNFGDNDELYGNNDGNRGSPCCKKGGGGAIYNT